MKERAALKMEGLGYSESC